MLAKRLAVAVMLIFLVQGVCAAKQLSFPAMEPVLPPSPEFALKVDNVLIIADVSRSMKCAGKADTERAFLTSFNGGIPNALKNAGLRTFGKSAYYHSVLVQPVAAYDRAAMAGMIGDLKAGCGNTPLASALSKALGDLEKSTGNIAVLIVSDGENLTSDPIKPTLALKELYGSRVCIYTVHVGECEAGRKMLEQVVQHGACGAAVSAAELQSEQEMAAFISRIFYEHEYMDSDGDGVLDSLDKCPGTPKGVKVDAAGCPLDSDGDGVPDYLDKCPDTPKGVAVDSAGCPLDSDGDGVLDYLDKCPGTPKGAAVDAAGCWIVKDLKFDYNKWDIKPEYYSSLDQVVRVLEMNPTIKVELHGHTDSIGSDAYNLQLSQKRANAVRDYLVAKGISADRVTAKGMGEADPIASNETPEGRARNRRVELNVISR